MKEVQIVNTLVKFYDEKEDIVWMQYLADEKDSDDLESAQQITEGIQPLFELDKAQCFMVDAPTFYIDKEVLDFYNKTDYGEIARAIIIKSFTTKVMGNMFMKLNKNKPSEKGRIIPVKLFNSHEKAVKWLREEMEKA